MLTVDYLVVAKDLSDHYLFAFMDSDGSEVKSAVHVIQMCSKLRVQLRVEVG